MNELFLFLILIRHQTQEPSSHLERAVLLTICLVSSGWRMTSQCSFLVAESTLRSSQVRTTPAHFIAHVYLCDCPQFNQTSISVIILVSAENGRLLMFGGNTWGQLGLGFKPAASKPASVKGKWFYTNDHVSYRLIDQLLSPLIP